VSTNGNGTTTATNTGSVGQYFLVSTNGNGTTTATNTGSISQYFQVSVNGSGTATAINSGRVFGGVRAQGSSPIMGGNLSVVNSGLVDSTGLAISFSGAGVISDTLTLLPGSRIIGAINLVGTNDTVVMNAGNQNLTFNTLAGATVTGNVPFVVVGNRIASIDPTPLAMQGRALNDFTREATSAIPQLSGIAPSGGAPLAFAAPDASARIEEVFASIPGLAAYSNEGMVFKNPTVIYGDGSAVWARGFAGSRVQPADGALLHASNQFYGGMLGGDLRLRPDLRLGAFIGMGNSRSAIDLNFGNSSSDLAFGGVYAQYDAGALFLRAALQGGGSHNFTTRNINENTIPGGLANATASFNGWYVSPEALVGQRLALGKLADASYTLTPSLKLRYLYGAYDGYTETGTTTAPITMGSRTVGTLEERGEVKLTRTVSFTPSDQLSTSIYGGMLGTQRAGDSRINAALLGQPIPFASPGPANVWGGFGGLGLEWQTRNVTLFSAGEYFGFSDNSTLVSGRAGLRVSF
jgi:outer membrane autotransporter protein